MTESRNGVPWPDIWRFKKPSRRPDVQEVEWATAREYYEQDVWRDRLHALRQLNLPDNAFEKVKEMGVIPLLDRMEKEGAIYPPTDEDRKRWYTHVGEEWDPSKSPHDLKTKNVHDDELRHALYWLLEVGQHKERIKSLVLLPSILGVNPDHPETQAVLSFWCAVSMTEELHKELPLPESVAADIDWDNVEDSPFYHLLQGFI